MAANELAAKLAVYAEQLAQVEQLLAADPANEQFLKLRTDLLEVTKLTEDLLKYKHEQSESQGDGDGGEAEGAAIDVSPFQVGMRCEGKFDDGTRTSWYPAVITAVSGGSYTVVYIGFGNTEVVGPDEIRPLLCDNPVDPSLLGVGFECVGRFSGDGKYYDVIVEEITDFGYKVQLSSTATARSCPSSTCASATPTAAARTRTSSSARPTAPTASPTTSASSTPTASRSASGSAARSRPSSRRSSRRSRTRPATPRRTPGSPSRTRARSGRSSAP